MFILFEEDGAFKAGSVLADNDATLQVESASGKRSKIKAANVLLRFKEPSPTALLGLAESEAAGIDPEFLWECAGEGEFAFAEFAQDYVGHAPGAVEATAVLLALQAAPIYFHRKGRGRFRKAPPDILKAALAGAEKKRLQAEAIERMAGEIATGTLPDEFRNQVDALLFKPDRNRPEVKALEAAMERSGKSAQALLFAAGAFRSAYELHYKRFLFDQFPQGTGFPEIEIPHAPDDLPRAEVQAFSIDDAATTEIDDALSVTPLPGIGWRIGIHIAAPGLGFGLGSPLDGVARKRLSTVYMPGNKITMLPSEVVDRFTLYGGRDCPALSLYLTVSDTWEILSHESRCEVVPIATNLRHQDVEPLFNAETLAGGLAEFPFRDELLTLYHFACACEGRRGKPSATQGVNDYNFDIEGDLENDPDGCRVHISERPRGSPLDKLVAELMIVANSTWGRLLADQKIPALYRAQVGGKVRMTTSPLPHEGLGVDCYAWSTSPLRRYVDLVNQWQLVAAVSGKPPTFSGKSDVLFAAMRDFELTYAAYADFQRGMERYWVIRWLAQEGIAQLDATVRKENLVKVDRLPGLHRVPSLPELAPGSRVTLAVDKTDLLDLILDFRFVAALGATAEVLPADLDGDDGDAGEEVEGAPAATAAPGETAAPDALQPAQADGAA